MQFQISRQPIFNSNKQVLGYELLYRSTGPEALEADAQASRLVLDTFQDIQLSRITGKRKAWIPFSEALVEQDIAAMFPSDRVVLLLREAPRNVNAFRETCRTLRARGYTLVLDDFALEPQNRELVECVTLVRVDFHKRAEHEVREFLLRNRRRGELQYVAKGLDTHEAFEKAIRMGFLGFQGDFLTKPVNMPGKSLRPLPSNYVRLLSMVNDNNVDLKKVADIVSQDVAMTYDLLRMLNTTEFAYRKRIQSVLLAVVALGVTGTKRWISLIVLAGLNNDQPLELLSQSLLRAEYLREIGKALNRKDADALFLLGLFSLMDCITGHDFKAVFEGIPMPEAVKSALIDHKGAYEPFTRLMVAQSDGDWDALSACMKKLALTPAQISIAYVRALDWSNQIIASKSA